MNFSLIAIACFMIVSQFIELSYASCGGTYFVRAGDTCYSISAANKCYFEDLLKSNPGINCQNLQIGQPICLPGLRPGYIYPYFFPYFYPILPQPQPQPLTGNCVSHYTIKSGDICYNIAENFGLKLNQLESYNPGLNCHNLQIGQQICLCRV